MYADAFGLLVFGPLLPSASLSKTKFFDRLKNPKDFCYCEERSDVAIRFAVILSGGRSPQSKDPYSPYKENGSLGFARDDRKCWKQITVGLATDGFAIHGSAFSSVIRCIPIDSP